MNYATHFATRATPQTQPIPGSPQVANNAGGFAFAVDDWAKLDRFLILGTEGGSYYTSEKSMTIDNAQAVLRCAQADGKRTVARIVEISEAGRAPKNDPAIFALAICAGQKIPEALAAVPRVCRIGTHLFQFIEAVEKFRGHGRALNRALRNWYLDKEPKDAAFQAVKYQQRGGWSHRDILRLCKPKASGDMNAVFHWIAKGWEAVGDQPHDSASLQLIWAFERAKRATDKNEVAKLIRDYSMPRECVPTQFLTEAAVWDALLEKMPLAAMVRNLATMTRVGLLAPMSAAVGRVVGELASGEKIKKSRLHPIAILAALRTYAAGRGERGTNTWTPVGQIVDALDGAFYRAFVNVEPTGKRWLLGLDVSGSMQGTQVSGMPFMSAIEAEAAMALVTAATEPQHAILAFDTSIKPVAITPRQRLDDATKTVARMICGGTDCALPIQHATKNRIPVDAFAIFTDSQTWAGNMHPSQAIEQYRRTMGIPAKLIVVAMCANEFSIGDAAGTLNVCGFDTAVPQLMSDYVAPSDAGR